MKYSYQYLEDSWTKGYWNFIQNNLHAATDRPSTLTFKSGWDWYSISANPNITWEIIKNNLNKPWCWKNISSHENITWEIIKNNPDKFWDWYEKDFDIVRPVIYT